jgi:hypothetical protein
MGWSPTKAPKDWNRAMKRLLASCLLVVTLLGVSGPVATAASTDTPPSPVQTSTWE